jgi:protein-histidine N-methyltransferase
MPFRFFAADPDSDDESPAPPAPTTNENTSDTGDAAPFLPPLLHPLSTLLPTLPPNIAYNFAPTVPLLPRRAVFDTEMQLKTSDDTKLGDLGDHDIRRRIYEGGLKSWECSIDLATYLSDTITDIPSKTLELGCGSALPSLMLFRKMLEEKKGGMLVLADYNLDVLKLVTLPNLILVWGVYKGLIQGEEKGDFDAHELFSAETFEGELKEIGIEVVFMEGAWGGDMNQLLGETVEGGKFDLVLGSETIYEPETAGRFTDVVLEALVENGKALIAAKKIYFGVGGGVDDFVKDVEGRGSYSCQMVRDFKSAGVNREIVEVVRK